MSAHRDKMRRALQGRNAGQQQSAKNLDLKSWATHRAALVVFLALAFIVWSVAGHGWVILTVLSAASLIGVTTPKGTWGLPVTTACAAMLLTCAGFVPESQQTWWLWAGLISTTFSAFLWIEDRRRRSSRESQ